MVCFRLNFRHLSRYCVQYAYICLEEIEMETKIILTMESLHIIVVKFRAH